MANYAGVGSRFIALLVDGIILGIIMLLIALPFGATSMMFGMMSPTGISNILGIIAMYSTLMIVWFVISLLYFSYFESKSGQTLGKKLVNIKVVTEKGKPNIWYCSNKNYIENSRRSSRILTRPNHNTHL